MCGAEIVGKPWGKFHEELDTEIPEDYDLCKDCARRVKEIVDGDDHK